MSDEAAIQMLLITQALDGLPPTAREAALSIAEFRRRQDLSITLGVKLGDDGPSFDRERLYGALRSVTSNAEAMANISDEQDLTWTVRFLPNGEDEPVYTIEHGDRCIRINDHSALAADEMTRAAWLNRTVAEVLPPPEWLALRAAEIGANALTDEAFAELMEDIEAMPAHLENALRADLRRGQAAPRLLVPALRRYYGRLVGVATPNMTATGYVDDVVGPMAERMIRHYGVRGLRYAVLCCSHSRITSFLPLDTVERGQLLEFYEWLAAIGDPISRIAGVEIALKYLDTLPELEPYVERIIDALLENTDVDESPYAVLGALITLAASEMARLRVLPDVPPFYRRQAAIAQASLVLRAFGDLLEDTKGIPQLLGRAGHMEVAFLQALVDLRCEPRYLPEYALPVQLRAEIIGRLRIAGVEHEPKITSASLRQRLIGPDCTVAKAAPWPRPFLPGPLEGNTELITALPDEFRAKAREAFARPHLDARSFDAAIEVAYLSGDVTEIAALASDALLRVNYIVNTDDDAGGSFATAMGLAVVAAAARSQALAKAVRILSRSKRRRGAFQDDPENEVRIALTAAAAFHKIDDWVEFFGSWITEIAFALEKRDRAVPILRMLHWLKLLEPALLPHVARAEAALSTVQKR